MRRSFKILLWLLTLTVVFVLVIGVLLRASVGPAESLLNMSGNERISAVALGATLFVSIALAIVLIPAYGLMGAAFAVSAAMVFESVALGVAVNRKLGIRVSVFSDMLPDNRRQELR